MWDIALKCDMCDILVRTYERISSLNRYIFLLYAWRDSIFKPSFLHEMNNDIEFEKKTHLKHTRAVPHIYRHSEATHMWPVFATAAYVFLATAIVIEIWLQQQQQQ